MDFGLNSEQEAILAMTKKLCADFGADYWLEKDRHGGFPFDFHAALAGTGGLGIAMPAEYGGAGLGIAEAALMLQAIA